MYKTELHFQNAITTNKNQPNKLLIDSFVGISPRRHMHVFRQAKTRKENFNSVKPNLRTNDSPYLKNHFLIIILENY